MVARKSSPFGIKAQPVTSLPGSADVAGSHGSAPIPGVQARISAAVAEMSCTGEVLSSPPEVMRREGFAIWHRSLIPSGAIGRSVRLSRSRTIRNWCGNVTSRDPLLDVISRGDAGGNAGRLASLRGVMKNVKAFISK
jgi:hypothetical protein